MQDNQQNSHTIKINTEKYKYYPRNNRSGRPNKALSTTRVARNPLSEWLFDSLRKHDMTASEVAEKLNITKNSISLWINGSQKIPFNRVMQLAEIFGSDRLCMRNLFFSTYEYDFSDLDKRLSKIRSLTESELEFLEIIRSSNVKNPKMNDSQKEMFKAFLNTLQPAE